MACFACLAGILQNALPCFGMIAMLSRLCHSTSCPVWAVSRPAAAAQAWQHARRSPASRADQVHGSAHCIIRAQAATTAPKHTTKSMAAVEGTKLLPLELVFGNARYRAPQVRL